MTLSGSFPGRPRARGSDPGSGGGPPSVRTSGRRRGPGCTRVRGRSGSWGLLLLQACLTAGAAGPARHAEAAGATVGFVDYDGPAMVAVESTEKHRLRITVDPRSERDSLTVSVGLPISGPRAWPAADVEVLDPAARAMPVQRGGIQWHKLEMRVPAEAGTYVVHVVDPPGERPRLLPESGRTVTDAGTGLRAAVCHWYRGRRAALSLRFDDSHPTHLSKAIPILREFGFRGTFMVNPGDHPADGRGRSSFQEHRSEWEAVARAGDHEFANHTLHHRGALNDAEMDQQVGDASKAIWALFPGGSRLLALNLGGGTRWTTSRTLRYYLDKYHLFDASSGSLGMDDTYGNRVSAFRRHVERHIERRGWCRAHFHTIGDGFSSSEGNFRAALAFVKEHEPALWIAGMANIHKYQRERRSTRLALHGDGPRQARLQVVCLTDLDLYDQPLTVELEVPAAWAAESVTVTGPGGAAIAVERASGQSPSVLLFDLDPIDATYLIRSGR